MRFSLLLLLSISLPLVAADTIIPWPHAFMTDAPDKLLQSARAIQSAHPDEAPTHLFHETVYSIDEAGRRSRTTRNVFFITNNEALEEHDATSVRWRPWYQSRPEMRVRVIDPEGGVHQLKPEEIVETAADDEAETYSEDRRLIAPLPNVRIGSLIEVEKVVPGLRPVFEGGDAWQDYFMAEPVSQRIVVEVPAKQTLNFHIDDSFAAKYKRKKAAGRRVHTWTLTEPPPPINYTTVARAGGIYSGRLTFATGASWQKVAAAYAAVIDQVATFNNPPFDLQAFVVDGDPRATAVNLLQQIHQRVRYSGLYLGDKDLKPTAPDQVLARGYGDCKDTAVLLVAMLRALDIPADVALVHSMNRRISADTPGLGLFDHTIVAVTTADGTPVFLDPTVPYNRVGALPFQLHGSQTLIANAKTKGLTLIPPADPAQHGMDFHFDFYPTLSGYGRMTVTYSGRGNHETAFREQFLDYQAEDDDAISRELARVGSADMSQAWSRTTETDTWEGLVNDFQSAVVSIPLAWSTEEIPSTVTFAADEPIVPVDLVDVGTFHLSYQFHLPAGYQLAETFAPVGFESEHLVLVDTRSSTDPTRGSLTLTLKPGMMSVTEIKTVNEVLKRLSETNLLLTFKHEGMTLLEEGEAEKAFAILKKERDQNPSLPTHFRLASAFGRWGMMEPALEEVAQGVKYEHAALDMMFVMPFILDNFIGTETGVGYLRDRALAIIEQQAKAFPDFPMLYFFSAYTREHGADGLMIADQNLLEQSGAEYAQAKLENFSSQTRLHYAYNRLMAGDAATAKTVADKLDNLMRDAFHIVLTAQQQGAEQALVIARRTGNTQERMNKLVNASDILARVRNYPAAAATLKETSIPQVQELLRMRRNMLANAKQLDVNNLNENDPFTPVYRLFANRATMATEKPFSDAQIQLPNYQPAAAFLEPPYSTILFGMAAGNDKQLANNQASIWDLFLGNLVMTYEDGLTETDRSSARIVKVTCPAFQVMQPLFYWVVPTADGYRIAATTVVPDTIGPAFAHALTRQAGAEAVQIFDHLLNLAPAQGRPGNSDLVLLWPALKQHEANPAQAAALLFHHGDPLKTKQIRALEALLDRVSDTQVKARLAYRIAKAYLQTPEPQRAAELYRTSYEAAPVAEHALNLLEIYDETGQDEAFKLLLDQWLEKGEQALKFAGHHATYYSKRGDYEGIAGVMAALRENPAAISSGIQNDLAWLALFRADADLDAAVADGESVLAMIAPAAAQNLAAGVATAGTHHTLATLYATLGKNQAAIDHLRQSVLAGLRFEPHNADWYVLGLVAQNLGFPDIARTYYARVEADDTTTLNAIHLARRRLAELDAAGDHTAADQP